MALYMSLFWALFGPAQGQMPFLTAKTADSGLENENILKLDEIWKRKQGFKMVARPRQGVLDPWFKVGT